MSATADQGNDEVKQKKSFKLLPSSPFARSFAEALLAGGLVLILLCVWMGVRSNRTAEMLQAKIPTKAAPIELSSEQVNTGEKNEGEDISSAGAKRFEPLPPAPVEGLTEPYGNNVLLPVSRIEDDLTPFEAYRKPFTPIAGKSLVSIVIVDFGLSGDLAKSILQNTPSEITLVVSPYAKDAPSWGEQARAAGHEFWLSMPMQTQAGSNIDTGPLSIGLNASLEENRTRLFTIMSSAVGYAGLVSQENHAFVKQDIDVSPVMKQVFGRGLAFAESNPTVPAYGLSMALEFAYPYVQNTFWLDASLRPADIDRALKVMERQALSKGKVVAFVHPYPVAIRKIQDWAHGAADKNIQLAPLSAMTQ